MWTTGLAQDEAVYEISWVPGQDLMVGTCHCGAVRVDEDPIDLWEWLLGHPFGH